MELSMNTINMRRAVNTTDLLSLEVTSVCMYRMMAEWS